jgi:hypothetical protein
MIATIALDDGLIVTSHDQAVNWPDQGIATHESAPCPVFGWRDFMLFGVSCFSAMRRRPQHHPRCFTVAVEFGADAEALDPIVR